MTCRTAACQRRPQKDSPWCAACYGRLVDRVLSGDRYERRRV